jgi:hypothetical protein
VRRYASFVEGPQLDPAQHREAVERARIWESILHVLRPVAEKAVAGEFPSEFDARVAMRLQLAATRTERGAPTTQPAADPAAQDAAREFLFAVALGHVDIIRRLYVGDRPPLDELLVAGAYEDVRRRIDSATSARFRSEEPLFYDLDSLQLIGQLTRMLRPADDDATSLVLRNP